MTRPRLLSTSVERGDLEPGRLWRERDLVGLDRGRHGAPIGRFRGDDPDSASYLRIEERELEARAGEGSAGPRGETGRRARRGAGVRFTERHVTAIAGARRQLEAARSCYEATVPRLTAPFTDAVYVSPRLASNPIAR